MFLLRARSDKGRNLHGAIGIFTSGQALHHMRIQTYKEQSHEKPSFKQLHSFLLLWGSQTVSQLGTAMTDYAVIIRGIQPERNRDLTEADTLQTKLNGENNNEEQ